MTRKVAIAFVHGIGTYADKFDHPDTRFDRHILKGLKKELGQSFSHVEHEAILWSDPDLEAAQKLLGQENDKDFFLSGDILSRFMIESMADAAAYQFFGCDDSRFANSNYLISNRSFFKCLSKLESRLETPDETPLVIVAQSMGCHVTSSYQWDSQRDFRRILGKYAQNRLSPFTRMETVASVFFTGCNIPLLNMGVPRKEKVPMRIPGKRMSEEKSDSVWKNYFDPDDVLGFRLEPEYRNFFEGKHPQFHPGHETHDPADYTPLQDIEFETSVLRGGMTPAAHVLYWKSQRVQKDIAQTLKQLIG